MSCSKSYRYFHLKKKSC